MREGCYIYETVFFFVFVLDLASMFLPFLFLAGCDALPFSLKVGMMKGLTEELTEEGMVDFRVDDSTEYVNR